MKTGSSIENGEDKTETKKVVEFKTFLIIEIFLIAIFVTIIIAQLVVSVLFFLFVSDQIELYFYIMVNNNFPTSYYLSNFATPKEVNYSILSFSNYASTGCPKNEWRSASPSKEFYLSSFTDIKTIVNAYPIDISNQTVLIDPDFQNKTLNITARGLKFYEIDIYDINPDKANLKTVELSTVYNFNFWKEKKYCRRRIFFDSNMNLLRIIKANLNCTLQYPEYVVEDCGSYYNGLYKMCVLRNFAIDSNGYNLANDQRLYDMKLSMCPINKIEILNNTFVYSTKNKNILNGKELNQYFINVFDGVGFQNAPTNIKATEKYTDIINTEKMTISGKLDYGFLSDSNVVVDVDDFNSFYTSSMDKYLYYKGFLNGTDGSSFYKLVDKSKSIRVSLLLAVFATFEKDCFENIFLKKGEDKLFGPPSKLNATSFFGFSLTIMIWTGASLFYWGFCLVIIRLRLIVMKLNNNINEKNREGEEVSKWTNTLIWAIIFLVKLIVVSKMISEINSQYEIITEYIKFNCIKDRVVLIFNQFQTFLNLCKEKCLLSIYLIIGEALIELTKLLGYFCIWRETTKKLILAKQRSKSSQEEKNKLN